MTTKAKFDLFEHIEPHKLELQVRCNAITNIL